MSLRMISAVLPLAAATAVLSLAAPAPAEEITFYFGSNDSWRDAWYPDSEYDGQTWQGGQNARMFSAFLGDGSKVNVRATAWSIAGSGDNASSWSNTHNAGSVGQWDYGLGVCNPDELASGCDSPLHTIDNYGQKDYIALHFDRTVDVEAMMVRLYDYLGGDGYDDGNPYGNDYTVLVGNVDTGFETFINPKTAFPTLSTLAQSTGEFFTDNGFGTESNFTWANGDGSGNVVLIGGDFSGGKPVDAFKLKTLTVDVWEGPPPGDVPAPAALGLLGLGVAALGLRRRQRSRAAA